MNKFLSKYGSWLSGFFLATALFLTLNHFSYFRFENSDDILIVKAFMGFEGGKPATFQLYQHTLLSYFIGWISTHLPGVPVFSLLQLSMLWLSVAIIAKSLCDLSPNRLSFLFRLLFSALYAALFAAFACARINFTTTAAMTGAASIAVLLSNHRRENPSSFLMFLSLLLLIGCYMLRSQTWIAILPFWFLSLGFILLPYFRKHIDKKQLRSTLIILSVGLIAFVSLWGIRTTELRDPELSALIDFQNANAGPMDYAEERLMSVSDSTLEKIGWSRAELALVQQWFFMDENITADAFRAIDAELRADTSLFDRISGAMETLFTFFHNNARYVILSIILLLLVLLVLCLHQRTADSYFVSALAVLTFLLMIAMLFYLAFQGRFLSRAADCALFPGAVILFALSLFALDRFSSLSIRRRVSVIAIVLIFTVLSACHAKLTLHTLSDTPDYVSASREETLENYALSHPDKLILRTPNLLRDTRLLPDGSNGIPANIMIWGDWNCRTPSWYHQLEVLGFDGHHFTAYDFLNPSLLFVTEKDAPPSELLEYISYQIGRSAAFTLEDSAGDLHFFSFQ